MTNRGVRGAGCLAALMLLVTGCSLGGESDGGAEAADEQTGAAETGPDVEALRAAWAEEVGAACTARNAELERLAQGLPAVVAQDGLTAAAAGFTAAEATFQEALAQAEPAPGDEAQALEMAAFHQEAGELRAQAIGAKYAKGDRQFATLMTHSDEAGEAAAAIATELGAEPCAAGVQGPYAGAAGLAAVRWGDRASRLCKARDKAMMSFRPTDVARYEAAARRWLRQTRALAPPEEYAARIKRFLDKYAASLEAQKQATAAYSNGDNATGDRLFAQGDRLLTDSTEIMYTIGFTIGFDRFCSAKPG